MRCCVVDEGVRENGARDALFLVDVIRTARYEGRSVSVYQLSPDAFVSQADFNGARHSLQLTSVLLFLHVLY